MNSTTVFRIVSIGIGVVMGAFLTATVLAEAFSPERLILPSALAEITAAPTGMLEDWASSIAPFRGDLNARYAMALAAQALQTGVERSATARTLMNEQAQAAARKALSLVPYDARTWLLLALLQMQRNPRDRLIVESLKMSYFTSPNDTELMPIRIDTVTISTAVADPDLQELARGDLRLILTRKPDLKFAILNAFRRAAPAGQSFLKDSVASIDPQFAALLHTAKQ